MPSGTARSVATGSLIPSGIPRVGRNRGWHALGHGEVGRDRVSSASGHAVTRTSAAAPPSTDHSTGGSGSGETGVGSSGSLGFFFPRSDARSDASGASIGTADSSSKSPFSTAAMSTRV